MSDQCFRCGADFAAGDRSIEVPEGTICTRCTVAGDEYRRQLDNAYESDVCGHCNGSGCGACHNTGEIPQTRAEYLATLMEIFSGAMTDACIQLERDYKNHGETPEFEIGQALSFARFAAQKATHAAAQIRAEEEVAA